MRVLLIGQVRLFDMTGTSGDPDVDPAPESDPSKEGLPEAAVDRADPESPSNCCSFGRVHCCIRLLGGGCDDCRSSSSLFVGSDRLLVVPHAAKPSL